MDTLAPEERSKLMGRIRGKNTRPEMLVRSMLHRAGYRFSLHRANLPGKPDIVLRKYKTIVFVHGCFWHRHKGCKVATTPKSNVEFWKEKFARNVANDRKHRRALRRLGWKVVTVWECELRQPDKVLARLARELAPEQARNTIRYPASGGAPLPMAAEQRTRYGAKRKTDG